MTNWNQLPLIRCIVLFWVLRDACVKCDEYVVFQCLGLAMLINVTLYSEITVTL